MIILCSIIESCYVIAIRPFFGKDANEPKVAVITGGDGGIGINVAKGLCFFGVKIIIGEA